MKRLFAITIFLSLWSICASAQIRMLPVEKRDSLIRAQVNREAFCSPDIQFDSLVAKMGTVVESTRVKAVYPFRKISRNKVEVGEIRTSCSCVKAVLKDNAIEAVYNTSGHIGRHPRFIEIYNKKDGTLLARLVLDCIVVEE